MLHTYTQNPYNSPLIYLFYRILDKANVINGLVESLVCVLVKQEKLEKLYFIVI